VLGRLDRRAYLSRYGGAREADKYSALDNLDLGALLASTTSSADTVYVFGFSAGAYVYADRRSASRFFWSRPVILDFNHEDSRYGVVGLFAHLQRTEPAMVMLQQPDWSPDVQDSAPFFHSQQALDGWLRGHYHPIPAIDGFEAWRRNRRCRRASAASRWPPSSSLRSCCAACSPRRIRRGGRRSAWCGTTKAPGSTTRATRRSSGSGGSTNGTLCSSLRCSLRWRTSRSRPSASACGRRGWCRKRPASSRSCCSRWACAASPAPP